jgi:hypothetical protein
MSAREEFCSIYGQLNVSEKALLIVRLALSWNVRARDTYGEGETVDRPVDLRCFNEAQNRLLSQLLKMLANSEQRYPDNVFCNIVVDQCEALRIDPRALTEFARAVSLNSIPEDISSKTNQK